MSADNDIHLLPNVVIISGMAGNKNNGYQN